MVKRYSSQLQRVSKSEGIRMKSGRVDGVFAGQVGGSDEDLRTVSFEAGSFEELEEQVTGWISSKREDEIVSISHSTGARWEKRYDKISFGKMEPVNTYTALLLVKDRDANVAA